MRYERLFIGGVGSSVPPSMSTADAIAAGVCTPKIAEASDVESVSVSARLAPPEMAVRAAHQAIDHAGCEPSDVGLLLHASGYYQGHDSWSAASFIQRSVIAGPSGCLAVEINQMSNGGMAALDVAAGYLTPAPENRAALITAADRFCPPGYNRWSSDPGTPLGDGGSAMVLLGTGGFAKVHSIASWSDAELEGMHRGDDPFGTAPFSVRQPVDMRAWQRAFAARIGLPNILQMMAAGRRAAMDRALADANLELSDVDWYVLPNLGRRRLNANYLRPLGIDVERTTWPWGRHVGHMGAADQFAGLTHLLRGGQLRPGDWCLLMGMGAGFTWSCACIEILTVPS